MDDERSQIRGWFARLVPYRFRRLHRAYAAFTGCFWLPCPACQRPFGGHEIGGFRWDRTRRWSGRSICTKCADRLAPSGDGAHAELPRG